MKSSLLVLSVMQYALATEPLPPPFINIQGVTTLRGDNTNIPSDGQLDIIFNGIDSILKCNEERPNLQGKINFNGAGIVMLESNKSLGSGANSNQAILNAGSKLEIHKPLDIQTTLVLSSEEPGAIIDSYNNDYSLHKVLNSTYSTPSPNPVKLTFINSKTQDESHSTVSLKESFISGDKNDTYHIKTGITIAYNDSKFIAPCVVQEENTILKANNLNSQTKMKLPSIIIE